MATEFTLSKDTMQDASNVIIQYLRDAGYTGSLEDGTALNDIVVKPNSVLRVLMSQLVDKAAAYQSLQKAYEMREEMGEEEFSDAIDCILSNWFVTRNDGKPSTGQVRLWFLEPPDFLHYKDGTYIGKVDNISVVADGEQVFTQDMYSLIMNTAENQNEYYIDVSVRTQENSSAALGISMGSKAQVSNNDVYYLRATVPGEFQAGFEVETSDAFIIRAEQAITTRELITSRAINTVLLDNFQDILKLYVARHGSREQLRDIVYYQGVAAHVGNKADIYLATRPIRQRIEVKSDELGAIDPAQLPHGTSLIGVIGAEDLEGNPVEVFMECEEKTWCSNRMLPHSLYVEVSCKTLKMDVLTDNIVGLVHDFVYSDAQRVACYDPMVKHMFPLFLYPKLKVYLNNKRQNSDNAIRAAVVEYVDYLVQNTQPWVASELIASVHVRVPNVKKIMLPLECRGVFYDPMSQQFHELEIGNVFTIGNDYEAPHSLQVTDNTVQFYCDVQMITIESDFEEGK